METNDCNNGVLTFVHDSHTFYIHKLMFRAVLRDTIVPAVVGFYITEAGTCYPFKKDSTYWQVAVDELLGYNAFTQNFPARENN